MKATFVSSASISTAMRYQLLKAQSELVKAQKEASTFTVADAGLALGARTGQSVSFERDLERLNGIIDTNKLVSERLKSTQDSLTEISDIAQNYLKTLIASASGNVAPEVTLADAKATLQSMTAILNTSFNGEFLFSGINTDVKPVNEFTSAGSPNKAAFDAAFLAHFGFAQTAPAAATITAAQMDTFMTNVVEPQFLGAGWQANWSNATDEGITSRIALNEAPIETSVSANEQALRKLAMASATIVAIFDSQVGEEARDALLSRAVAMLGEASTEIGDLGARTGIIESRVMNASERIDMQANLFEKSILGLKGIDPYEASARVSILLQQIETSYALTARIQQLSLVKFLA